jgi:hypothetical protein
MKSSPVFLEGGTQTNDGSQLQMSCTGSEKWVVESLKIKLFK